VGPVCAKLRVAVTWAPVVCNVMVCQTGMGSGCRADQVCNWELFPRWGWEWKGKIGNEKRQNRKWQATVAALISSRD
jgi:hypothetical protein